MPAMHSGDHRWRRRARRALVVGKRPDEGMRAAHGCRWTLGQDQGRMSDRKPQDTPARIAPLANLPLFHKLAERKAVVVGTSDSAEWKAELLAAAGTEVVRLTDGWTTGDLAG